MCKPSTYLKETKEDLNKGDTSPVLGRINLTVIDSPGANLGHHSNPGDSVHKPFYMAGQVDTKVRVEKADMLENSEEEKVGWDLGS